MQGDGSLCWIDRIRRNRDVEAQQTGRDGHREGDGLRSVRDRRLITIVIAVVGIGQCGGHRMLAGIQRQSEVAVLCRDVTTSTYSCIVMQVKPWARCSKCDIGACAGRTIGHVVDDALLHGASRHRRGEGHTVFHLCQGRSPVVDGYGNIKGEITAVEASRCDTEVDGRCRSGGTVDNDGFIADGEILAIGSIWHSDGVFLSCVTWKNRDAAGDAVVDIISHVTFKIDYGARRIPIEGGACYRCDDFHGNPRVTGWIGFHTVHINIGTNVCRTNLDGFPSFRFGDIFRRFNLPFNAINRIGGIEAVGLRRENVLHEISESCIVVLVHLEGCSDNIDGRSVLDNVEFARGQFCSILLQQFQRSI